MKRIIIKPSIGLTGNASGGIVMELSRHGSSLIPHVHGMLERLMLSHLGQVDENRREHYLQELPSEEILMHHLDKAGMISVDLRDYITDLFYTIAVE